MTERRARIVVRGPNVLQRPLLETEDAKIIEFYGPDDTGLMALMVRTLSDSTWALITQADEDWTAALVRYGYMTPTKPAEQILESGL